MLANLLPQLQEIDSVNEYYLYSNREFTFPVDPPRWQKRVQRPAILLPGPPWYQTGVRKMIARDRLEAYLGTLQVLPLGLPREIRKVLIVHDLVWRLHPETMSPRVYLIHWFFAERSIRRADYILCVSESTRRDLRTELGVPAEKIGVVPHAAGAAFAPRDRVACARAVAAKYRVSEDYLCTVGTVEPRKNLATLIEAVNILREKGSWPYQLLIAGASGWKTSSIHRSVVRLGLAEKEVKFLGYVPEEDLPQLYGGARAFVFPSLYEGFGIPLVEAMACGVPIVASDVPSTSEVVGEAGLLVPPDQPQSFAEAMARVVTEPDLRHELCEKGIERARQFRSEDSARKLLQALEGASSIS